MSAYLAFAILVWCIFHLARKENRNGFFWIGLTSFVSIVFIWVFNWPLIVAALGSNLGSLVMMRMTSQPTKDDLFA